MKFGSSKKRWEVLGPKSYSNPKGVRKKTSDPVGVWKASNPLGVRKSTNPMGVRKMRRK
jgi:hypothetical protein